jgi:hypothetical protein
MKVKTGDLIYATFQIRSIRIVGKTKVGTEL